MTYYRTIDCPHCHGTGWEPSVVTEAVNWCTYCHGRKWFYGTLGPPPASTQRRMEGTFR